MARLLLKNLAIIHNWGTTSKVAGGMHRNRRLLFENLAVLAGCTEPSALQPLKASGIETLMENPSFGFFLQSAKVLIAPAYSLCRRFHRA